MNVPKLRFKEFTDEWKLYKLNELCNIKGRIGFRGYTTNDLVGKESGGAISLSPSNIVGTSINTNKENTYISNFKYEESPEIKIYNGDIIFTKTGSSYGKVALVENLSEKATLNPQLVVLKDINCNRKVLCELIASPSVQHQIENTIVGGTIPTLSQNIMSEYKLYLPSINEQTKLGNMLQLLDKKIELQSKKIEALKLYKKGLIIKLNIDKSKWNEYKIADIFNITRGIVIPKNKLSDDYKNDYIYPVYSSQTSNNGILGYDKTYDFDGKYLTWTTDGANAGKVFFRDGKFRCTNVCGILFNDNNLYIDELTAELLNLETPKHVSYVGNPKLMNNVMSNIKILLPNKNESENINSILKKINTKIDLEVYRLDKLQDLKKGLMQSMLV